MQFNWNKMDPEFSEKCQHILKALQDVHVLMVPYFGHRTLEEQAKLWRQGRSTEYIKGTIARLKRQGAPFLAYKIECAGPQPQPKIVTNALPGFSWHNWGMALDCYATIDNNAKKPNWDGKHADYKLLEDIAAQMGITSGRKFSFTDSGHLQLHAYEVSNRKSLREVNSYFELKDGI